MDKPKHSDSGALYGRFKAVVLLWRAALVEILVFFGKYAVSVSSGRLAGTKSCGDSYYMDCAGSSAAECRNCIYFISNGKALQPFLLCRTFLRTGFFGFPNVLLPDRAVKRSDGNYGPLDGDRNFVFALCFFHGSWGKELPDILRSMWSVFRHLFGS